MMQRIRNMGYAFVCCALLAALLLCVSCAKGDLLLFTGTADCETAPLSSRTMSAPHAVVLQKADSAAQEAARRALAKAGVEAVDFLGLPAVNGNRTAGTLAKKWAKPAAVAAVASLLRRYEDESIIWFAEQEAERLFLSGFAEQCAAGANDPDCRADKKQPDEYLHEVRRLIDGMTGEERSPEAASWRDDWNDGAEYDLSALPQTDGDGFLPEGEYVLEDEKQGLWVYLSPALQITVTRHQKDAYSWFEADIRRRPEGETLHVITSLNGRGNDPAKVAKENSLVLGINTDYHQVRINNKKKTGLIIRGGKVVRESSGAQIAKAFPNFDTLLLDAEGGFRLDRAGGLDSAQALALGAVDVLAFGPILVKDGRVRMLTASYHGKKEPRTAVGYLGENHYLMVVAEGRMRNAVGMSLDSLGRLMAARGCTEAINLDGGHTSVMVFMGKRLNRIGNLSGTGTTPPRNMAELLGIGTYGQ